MYRILLYCLLSLPLIAQTPKGNYLISGSVVNSVTGDPIKNALVILNFLPGPRVSGTPPTARIPLPAPMSILAGIGGDFVFNNLPEGQYRLTAEKPGFIVDQDPSDPLRPGVITLASSLTNARLKLAPLGVIEGKVVDQNGEPVQGVNVVAISVSVVDGLRTTRSQRSVFSNDAGGYRLWNLQTGKYYVKAAGRGGGTFTYIGDNGPVYDSTESFAPVYSGGAQNLDSATPVIVGPGTHARADLNLIREPAMNIRGTISNFIPYQAVKFELLRGEEDVSASRVALNGATGRFEIQDVTPGTYLLRVTQGEKTRSETLLTVINRDITNMLLVLSPAVTVKAVVRVVGLTGSTRVGDQDADVEEFQPNCQLALHGAAHSSDRTYSFTRGSDENLNAVDVLPGVYRLGVQCFGGYVLSALSGSTDLLSNSSVAVQPGAAPAPIEITIKAGGGVIRGNLTVKGISPEAAILLVPASSVSTGPSLVPVVEAHGDMLFGSQWLAPGDYTLYAFSQRDEVEYRNSLFLQSLTGGVSVHVAENDEKEINLTSVVR
jgi:hypothetical protein